MQKASASNIPDIHSATAGHPASAGVCHKCLRSCGPWPMAGTAKHVFYHTTVKSSAQRWFEVPQREEGTTPPQHATGAQGHRHPRKFPDESRPWAWFRTFFSPNVHEPLSRVQSRGWPGPRCASMTGCSEIKVLCIRQHVQHHAVIVRPSLPGSSSLGNYDERRQQYTSHLVVVDWRYGPMCREVPPLPCDKGPRQAREHHHPCIPFICQRRDALKPSRRDSPFRPFCDSGRTAFLAEGRT